MTSEKTILEIRRHSLMSAIMIGVTMTVVYTLHIALGNLSDFERITTPSLLGVGVDEWGARHLAISLCVTALIISYIAIKLTQLASRFKLYGTTTHLPSELYPLLVISMMVNISTLRMALVSMLVVYSIFRFFRSYRAANSSGTLANGAIALGVATLLYPPVVAIWGAVPFVLILFERKMREVIVTIASLLIVPFGYVYVKWLMGGEFMDEMELLLDALTTHSGYSIIDSIGGVVIAAFTIVLYLSINAVFAISLLDNTFKARRRLWVLVAYGCATMMMLLIPSSDTSTYGILAVPLSILIPVTLLKLGRMMSFILYLSLFICAALSMCGLF